MTNANMHNKDEKFLFNVHVFDADIPQEPTAPEDLAPPPPPMFSQEELEAAKKIAFTQGRAQAEAEARASREQQQLTALQTIARDMKILIENEDLREQIYEFEAVRLSEQIFAHMFPLYAQAYGFHELQAAIREIIKAHNGSGLIRVHVHPALAEPMGAFMNELAAVNPDLRCDVKADETLDEGACKIGWAHGGAVRDSSAMAAEIQSIMQAALKDALAARPAKGHDEYDGLHERGDKGETP